MTAATAPNAPSAPAAPNEAAPAASVTAILAGLLAAGTALRLLLLSHQSFWYDETVSTRLAESPLADILAGRARDLGNPPLHLILLHLWIGVFGAGDAAARALSAVAGAASIPLVFMVARRLVDRRAALAATAVFALAPVQIYFSQEARVYTLVTLICLGSTAFLLRAVEAPRRPGAWVGYGATTFLAMYAHYFATFVVLAQVAWLLLVHRRQRRILLGAAAALAGAGLMYGFVWLPSLIAQATTKGNLGRAADTWYLQILATPMVFGVGTTLLWKGSVSAVRIAAAAVALAVLGGSALAGAFNLRRRPESLALILAWLLVPVLLPLLISLTLFPFYYVRYALVAAPAYYILIGAGLTNLRPALRGAAGGALAVAAALSLGFYFTGLVKHDWRSAAAWAAANLRPGDLMAFDADIGETAFSRYAGADERRIRLLEPPAAAPAPAPAGGRYWGTSSRKEPIHVVDGQLREARRVWFVFSDPQSGAGDYYRTLFQREWRRVGGHQVRGIDLGIYEGSP